MFQHDALKRPRFSKLVIIFVKTFITMQDYYGQFDDSIDCTLQELTNYVSHILNIEQNGFDRYVCGYEYTDAILLDRLSKFPHDIVIPRLESLLQSLQTITRKHINIAIPDIKQWDGDEIIDNSKERKLLFDGIKKTIQFVSNILSIRKKISTIKPLNLLNFNGDDRKLNQFKRELKDFYDNTPYFNAVFRGQAPNERINWKMAKFEFRYFMKILFQKLLSKGTVDWQIVSNSFTLNGEVTSSLLKSNNGDVNTQFKRKVNTAFDILLN